MPSLSLEYTESSAGEDAFLQFDSTGPAGEVTITAILSTGETPYFTMLALAREGKTPNGAASGKALPWETPVDTTVMQYSALGSDPELQTMNYWVFAAEPVRQANTNRKAER